jgi:chorismate mutase
MKQSLEYGMAEICDLRLSIDNLDAALINILAERFQRTRRIGQIKAELSIPAVDPEREAAQAARLRRLAATARLDPEFAVAMQQFIVHEVVRQHEALRRD